MHPRDHFTFRQVYQCAPLVIDGYNEISDKVATFSKPSLQGYNGTLVQKYYYGNHIGMPVSNLTYQYVIGTPGSLATTEQGLDYTIK